MNPFVRFVRKYTLPAMWLSGILIRAAIATFLFQLGSYLEQKTLTKTRSAIKALTELSPTTAWRLAKWVPEEIDAATIPHL